MSSPVCTVNGGSTTNGVDVVDDLGTVTIQLVDLSADVWTPSITGSDDLVTPPPLTINSTTKTATFTKPAGPWALLFQSQVNGGVNIDGQIDETLTTTFEIHIKVNGTYRLVAVNERGESSAAFGWVTKVNAAIRALSSAGGGGGYNVQQASGGAASITVPSSSTNQYAGFSSLSTGGTVQLPASPTSGETVLIVDEDGSLSSNAISVVGNGKNIKFRSNAAASSVSLTGATIGANGSCTFVYNGTIWVSVS